MLRLSRCSHFRKDIGMGKQETAVTQNWWRRVFIVVEIIIVQGAHMVIYRLTRVFNMRLLSRLLVKTIAVALSPFPFQIVGVGPYPRQVLLPVHACTPLYRFPTLPPFISPGLFYGSRPFIIVGPTQLYLPPTSGTDRGYDSLFRGYITLNECFEPCASRA